MSYHIEGNGRFNDLPERILMREDGYMTAYKFYGEPIVDYWYVPEAENAKLRELLQRTWDAFHDATAREFVTVKNDLRELGVEVDG